MYGCVKSGMTIQNYFNHAKFNPTLVDIVDNSKYDGNVINLNVTVAGDIS